MPKILATAAHAHAMPTAVKTLVPENTMQIPETEKNAAVSCSNF